MIISRNTLTLRSRGSDIDSMAASLEGDFSKEQLKNILESFGTIFNEYNLVTSTRILSEYIPEVVKKYTTIKKAEIANCVAILLSSQDCVTAYLNHLPLKAVDVFRLVFKNVYLSHGAAKDIFGREVAYRKKGWSYYNNVPMELDTNFALLKCEVIGSWSSSVDYIVMPRTIRNAVAFYLRPEPLPVVTCKDYTPAADEAIYSTRLEVEPLYPVMHTLYLNGMLEMGKTKVTATTLKRISRHLQFKEFYSDERDKMYKSLAGTMATTLFCLLNLSSLSRRKTIPDPPQVTARHIVSMIKNSVPEMIDFFGGLLLSKVYQVTFDTANLSLLLKGYFSALEKYAADEWLMAESIENLLRNSNDFPDNLLVLKPMQVANYIVHNEFSGKYIAPFTIISQFSIPVIHMITGALAALGMVEMAYTKKPCETSSPLDGIRAVRLTPLGKYALGLTDEYESALSDAGPIFEFDEERLIMRTIGDINPFEGLISNYLVPVGEHRYAATSEKFIDGCSSPRDLDKKISNFKALTGDILPQNWKDFLEGLMHRSGSITEPDMQVTIFKVDPDDEELVSIISSDPKLQQLVICAEGFLLLVKDEDIGNFKKRMSQFGYLV